MHLKSYEVVTIHVALASWLLFSGSIFAHTELNSIWCTTVISGVRRKFPRGDTKFRHNRVTSQINFRGSAEGTTILGGGGGKLPGKFCQITPKNTYFRAFWKQVLDNTVFTFFYI